MKGAPQAITAGERPPAVVGGRYPESPQGKRVFAVVVSGGMAVCLTTLGRTRRPSGESVTAESAPRAEGPSPQPPAHIGQRVAYPPE